MWDLTALSGSVRTYAADGFDEPGMKALFFEGQPYEGKPTRVFAWLGLPKKVDGGKTPGMVLVHGGGGTAFAEWVRLWTGRGYAAIAMDTCGRVPVMDGEDWRNHDYSGPLGRDRFGEVDRAPQEQWQYHAVAAVIQAHTLLREHPAVDAERIGLTGISWGGYLSCITAGVDDRFKFAAPVYGCGYLGANSAWLDELAKLGQERCAKWLKWWDPAVYLANAAMPMLWVSGTNDFAYPMDSLQKSYRLPRGKRQLCIRVRMDHGHGGAGENPPEIGSWANYLLRGSEGPLPEITQQQGDAKTVELAFVPHRPVVQATLNYSKHCWNWLERPLTDDNARIDWEGGRINTDIPADVEAYYINLIDRDGQAVSSEHITLP